MAADESFSPELLKAYYRSVFPAELMCRWLGYATAQDASAASRLLRRREFSFTTGDDVYIRYLCYDDARAFRKDLVDKLPYKIDIGAAFSAPPSEKGKFKAFQPVQRELIFDIDLTDYDFLPVDASKLDTCDAAWPFMAVAVKALDRMLRLDFGFEHLLWVYSGRRGIHCHVCDARARVLSNEARSAVADYLGLHVKDKRMVVTVPLHPTLAKVHREVVMPFFEQAGLALLEDEAAAARVLDMLRGDHAQVADALADEFARKPGATGAARWQAICKALERAKAPNCARTQLELQISLCYPRLDAAVSKTMNHLLKSPWCAHPKTGRVCVPFDPETAESFNPADVPTLGQVVHELNEFDAAHQGDEAALATDALHKTRLAVPADLFAKFVRGLEAAERKTAAAESRAVTDMGW